MKSIRSVLVHVDTRISDQPVLRRAVELAQQHSAALTVVDVVPDISWAMRMTGGNKDVQGTVAEKKQSSLDQIVADLKGQGIDARCRVLIGKASVEIIAEVKHSNHDLVIKDAKGIDSQRAGFFGTTATRLMRFCPCTVWAYRAVSGKGERVLAAIDATAVDEQHEKLNRHILETAAALNLQGEPHVVHAWSVYGEKLIRDYMKRDEFEALVRDAEQEAKAKTAEVLKTIQLPADSPRVHLLRGSESEVLSSFVSENHFDVVVIGTVARSGVSGFLIGNTAEMLLERVECSIVAVKLPA